MIPEAHNASALGPGPARSAAPQCSLASLARSSAVPALNWVYDDSMMPTRSTGGSGGGGGGGSLSAASNDNKNAREQPSSSPPVLVPERRTFSAAALANTESGSECSQRRESVELLGQSLDLSHSTCLLALRSAPPAS